MDFYGPSRRPAAALTAAVSAGQPPRHSPAASVVVGRLGWVGLGWGGREVMRAPCGRKVRAEDLKNSGTINY